MPWRVGISLCRKVRYKRVRPADGKWVESKDNHVDKDKNGKEKWWMEKMMGAFERKLVELIYEVVDSKKPLYMTWVK